MKRAENFWNDCQLHLEQYSLLLAVRPSGGNIAHVVCHLAAAHFH